VRKPHAALNTLLQSAGAIICKRWLVMIDQELQAAGLRPGEDYEFSAWIHDELVIAVRAQRNTTLVAETARRIAGEVEQYYRFQCPLEAETHIGASWAAIH
jgi:DNA polymerase-1